MPISWRHARCFRTLLVAVLALTVARAPRASADVLVALRGRNDLGLTRHVGVLTPAEVGQRYGATPRAMRRVSRWLAAVGCRVQRWPGRELIRCRGAHVPSPPANIAADIDAVIDDDDLVWRAPTLVTVAPRAHNSAGDLYLSPAEFTRVYELDSASAGFLDGTGVTIAVLGLSQIDPADVATFRTGFGLPPIDFAQGAGVRTGGNVEIEAVLDVTWAGALAPAAHIRLVQIVGSSVTDVFRGLVGSNVDVISSSIDLCVKPRRRRAAALRVLNRVLRQAKAQGQTVLVASGDNGNSECAGGGFGLIESSPFVTAVGGTVPLPQESDTEVALGYGNEVAWSKSGGGSAGGGRPSWQRGLPGRGRVLPDVAFPAEVIYPLVFGGRRILVGGTSAGTPAWAGVIARLVQQRGRVGWINPRLYALGRAQKAGTGAAVFHDVVNGSNGTFAAGPGFDLVTGWGSIAGAAFLRNF